MLLAAAAALSVATPAVSGPDVDSHIELLHAIENKGVEVWLNRPLPCKRGILGAYLSRYRGSVLLVCQENRDENSRRAVRLTEEDADTIRHEAWHMVQDCATGELGDAELDAVLITRSKVLDFARDVGFPSYRVRNVIRNYSENGATNDVVTAEIEAHAVAHAWSADRIRGFITRHCRPV